MKKYNYANRGQSFEDLIIYANELYKYRGIAVIVKQPTEFKPLRNGYGQIVSCKVEKKATVDFIGRIGNRPIAIEAKETHSDSIRFDRVADHQCCFLDDFTRDDAGDGIVLVSFSLKTCYAVPWVFWRAAREAWLNEPKSKVTIEYKGQVWTTTGKASVKESEMLQDWRVEVGGRFGLDYLATYSK